MTTLTAAWEMDCVEMQTGTATISTTAGFRDTNFSSNVFQAQPGTTDYKFTMPSLGTFWFHASMYNDDFNNSEAGSVFRFRNSTTDQLQFVVVTGGSNAISINIKMQRWNGSAWSDIAGTTVPIMRDFRYTIDLYVNMHATTGSAKLFLNGFLMFHVTNVNTSGTTTTCDNVILGGFRTSNTLTYWSEIIVSDEMTVGHRVTTLHPSAAGTYTEWTGAYTAVDEFDYSTADSVSTNATAQRFTFNLDNTTTANQGSRKVVAVITACRMLLEAASTPTNFEFMVRTGATDYTSGNVGTGLTTSDKAFQYAWYVSPNTSAAWTFTNIDALEAGVKSS